MLSILDSVKVLLGKEDQQNYRSAGVEQTMMSTVQCISADSKVLLPLIVWSASTH
jgi:hypothetical protein